MIFPFLTHGRDKRVAPVETSPATAARRLLIVGDGRDLEIALGTADGDPATDRYSVDAVPDTAVTCAREIDTAYDLIILALPRALGRVTCRAMRASGVSTPILLVSDGGGVDDIVAGLDAGADDCLRGPMADEELRARLSALARRHARFAATRATTCIDDPPATLTSLP